MARPIYFRLAGDSKTRQVTVPMRAPRLPYVQSAIVHALALECEPRTLRLSDLETGQAILDYVRPGSTLIVKMNIGKAVSDSAPEPEPEPKRQRTFLHSHSTRRVEPIGARPPPTYVCKLCREPGHFCRQCPNLERVREEQRRVPKPATGIPRSQMVPVEMPAGAEFERPVAGFVHVNGRTMAVRPNEGQFERIMRDCKFEPEPNHTRVRFRLLCSVCEQRWKDPVTSKCCFTTYCEACVMDRPCPTCKASVPDWFENTQVRKIL